MLPAMLAFVDVETSGLSVTRDRIIEIGIVRVENGKIVDTYQTLINPQTYLSPEIERITGISKSSLEDAPIFDDVKRRILEILDGCIFVAHNVRFDYGFLRNELKRCETNYSSKHFCTVKLSRTLFPEMPHHNLDSIIEKFGFSCERRHRAFDDAKILWDFYQAIQKEVPLEKIEEALTLNIKKSSLPSKLPVDMVENLPEEPGVYIFYGENGSPLYIGKSVNIKCRVMSHFTSDYSSSREMVMCQQIESIETIITAGELGALIKESELIKKMQPIYNRKLRLSRKLLILRALVNKDGYQEVMLEEVIEENLYMTENILGIYKSKKQAKGFLTEMAKKHQLCVKLLGLEKTKSACFSYRLGKCNGACIGEEKSFIYNMRFLTAFSLSKIKSWPFTGPIEIREKNELEEKEAHFLIDRWCLLPSPDASYHFDMDVYKIVLSYLQNTKNHKNIHQISQNELVNFYS